MDQNIIIPKNREEEKEAQKTNEDSVYSSLQAEIRKLHMKLHQKELMIKQQLDMVSPISGDSLSDVTN